MFFGKQKFRGTILLLSILALLVLGCAPAATPTFVPPTAASGQTDLTVFAAASLTESFKEIAQKFEADHPGVKVVYNFGGSNILRAQLEQGARADVFASANTTEMEHARKAGLIADDAQVFANNRLVVILPADNPGKIETLHDLAKPGVKLVFAEKNVPVGGYTLAMLDKMSADPAYGADLRANVLKNVVSQENNVKAVVTKVSLGEADAGVSYISDVTPDLAPKIKTFAVPDAFNQIAKYPIAALRDAAQPDLARQFIAFVLAEDGGQAILAKWNFVSVK
jgi:molybdate transport system substrate-binding protein